MSLKDSVGLNVGMSESTTSDKSVTECSSNTKLSMNEAAELLPISGKTLTDKVVNNPEIALKNLLRTHSGKEINEETIPRICSTIVSGDYWGTIPYSVVAKKNDSEKVGERTFSSNHIYGLSILIGSDHRKGAKWNTNWLWDMLSLRLKELSEQMRI